MLFYVSPTGEGGLQNLLGNMSHNQLMQLIGPTGLGGIGIPTLYPIKHLATCHLRRLRVYFCCVTVRWSRGSCWSRIGEPPGWRQQCSCSQHLLHKVSNP